MNAKLALGVDRGPLMFNRVLTLGLVVLIACGRALNAMSMILVTGRSWVCGPS